MISVSQTKLSLLPKAALLAWVGAFVVAYVAEEFSIYTITFEPPPPPGYHRFGKSPPAHNAVDNVLQLVGKVYFQATEPHR